MKKNQSPLSAAISLKKCFITVVLMVAQAEGAMGAGEHKHEKSKAAAQKVHAHGQAMMQLVIQDLELALRFEGPAEGVFGFEHKPKTEKQKTVIHDVEKKIKTDLQALIGLDPALGCSFYKLDVDHDLESESSGKTEKDDDHADVEIDAKAKCSKSPVGSKLKFVFLKEFKRIKKLKLEVLSGDKVKSQTLTKSQEEVQL